MRKGGGKGKGGSFERQICKALSLWVSRGKKEDLFWRSAMSGGRATVARKKGKSIRQAGDITAVAPEGHILTDHWYIECKFYKDLNLHAFLFEEYGPLYKFWRIAVREARKHDREPMLIAKQNQRDVIVLAKHGTVRDLIFSGIRGAGSSPEVACWRNNVQIWLLDSLLDSEFEGPMK